MSAPVIPKPWEAKPLRDYQWTVCDGIPSLKQFDKSLIKRHDVVHRSGFTKTGDPVIIDAPEIYLLCDQIESFANYVSQELSGRNKGSTSLYRGE
jgi:hypothetical protein